jgi:hypothetical protein
VAGPLSDIAQLNFQLDASYTHNWAHNFSREDWDLGGSVFWGGMDGRFGADVQYVTATHIGHATTYGAFGEWYFGDVTGMVKGGWISSGGAPIGGRGNYMGAALDFYVMPNLGITGGIEWGDLVTGRGCQTCGRGDVLITSYEAALEFLFSEEFGLAGFAGYTYAQDHSFGFKTHDNIWRVGLRWYTGTGTLEDHHRNGNLNPWLPGLGSLKF